MKRLIKIFFIFIFLCLNTTIPAISEDFNDETLTNPIQEISSEEELMFAPIDLDLSNYEDEKSKSNKRLILRVEKNEKPRQVKNTNQIWDGSKIYHYQYYGDQRHLNPISATGVLGSKLETQIDDNTTVTIGQDGLDSYNGYSLSFIYNNGSVYNTGAKISGKEDYFDYSIGAFTHTETLERSYGGVISSKPSHILNSKGTFAFGSSVYTNLTNEGTRNTTGLFSTYQRGRLAIGGQISQTSYANGSNLSNSVHILPTLKLNEHLYLTSKFVRNVTTQESIEELGIRYKPFKSEDSVVFDVTGTTYHNSRELTRQRLKVSTSFRI